MGEYNESLGRRYIVEVDGREWKLSPTTPNVIRDFENWAESGVRQGIVSQRSHFPHEDYCSAIEAFGRNVFLKKYRWGHEICREILLSGRGWIKYFALLLRMEHGEEIKRWTEDEFLKLYQKNIDQFREAMEASLEAPKDEDSPSAAK